MDPCLPLESATTTALQFVFKFKMFVLVQKHKRQHNTNTRLKSVIPLMTITHTFHWMLLKIQHIVLART